MQHLLMNDILIKLFKVFIDSIRRVFLYKPLPKYKPHPEYKPHVGSLENNRSRGLYSEVYGMPF
jgi:hypothetical protein